MPGTPCCFFSMSPPGAVSEKDLTSEAASGCEGSDAGSNWGPSVSGTGWDKPNSLPLARAKQPPTSDGIMLISGSRLAWCLNKQGNNEEVWILGEAPAKPVGKFRC